MSNSIYTSVQVHNFGPIRHGEIKLRPLTVFTGASNTGKSWLATLVYALAQHSLKTQRHFFHFRDEFLYDSDDFKNFDSKDNLVFDDFDHSEEIKVSDSLLTFFNHASSKYTKNLEIEIARSFGFHEIQQAISWKSKNGASIRVSSPSDEVSDTPSAMSIQIENNCFSYSLEYPETLKLDKLDSSPRSVVERLQTENKQAKPYNERRSNNFAIARFLYQVLNNRYFNASDPLYLPAGRVGLMDSFRTIVSSSLQSELDNVANGRFQSRPLSGVLVDFLQMLTKVTPNGSTPQKHSAVSRFEEELLQGRIEVKLNQLNFPYFFFKPLDTDQLLPLNLTSSMVSQLAPVIVLIKEIPQSNNLVVLEEPEAHMHPKQQVRFIEEIVNWVRDGNKIILTTHSEWLTEALSNIVMVNKINPNLGIEAKDVGLWRFIAGTNGSEIKEAAWSLNGGGYDDGFEEVGDNLLNEWNLCKGELS